ncbi:hypothetical protein SO802_019387 [Lithocarpus litseifolius]|uniref:PGG domain-containing protein n=1 Tax=Lithocarpus litseifolius TaxID=425828 RepID=A0AAW2CSQ7_9ROSI
MGDRIQRLKVSAELGNIDEFYAIIGEEETILEHFDVSSFVETPLHTSASAGQFPFSYEMMILKPSFVSKRNPAGHTPIYLALHNGHTETVRQLLQHNADLVRVKGKKCMTPLHYTVERGSQIPDEAIPDEAKKEDYLALLEKFLSVCPDSIEDVTTQNETALHIALKSNNLEAFKLLVGWLLRKWPHWREILELKDVEGNTVLHVAVSKNQTQAVSHLLACGERFAYLNEKNLEGKTALDILLEQPHNSEMRAILDSAGALTASSLPTVTSSYAHYLMLPKNYERVKILIERQLEEMTDDRRSALLVVAALLVTVTYQAVITPPGGLWQDDHFKYNTTDALRGSSDDLFKLNITAPHRAGSATARRTNAFAIFLTFNSFIFLTSIASMVILVPPDGLVGANLTVYSAYLCFGYFSSLMIITQASERFARIIIYFSPLYGLIVGVALIIAPIGLGYLLKLHGLGYWLKLHGRNK